MGLNPNNQKQSKVKVVQVPDGLGGWRAEIKMESFKFDEEAKGIFLEEYAKHGRMGTACKAAHTTSPTVRRHMKSDINFAEAMIEAEQAYQSRVIEHHQNLIFDGTERVQYGRDGNITSTEKIYPIQLIAMELRKVDESYRDKREVSVAVTSGVMVAPPELTLEEWEKQFGRQIEDNEGDGAITIEHDDNVPVEST